MKVNRHAKIIELINKYHVETQEELAEYLKKAGYAVTQATVSRDIRELKLPKIPVGQGKQKYIILKEDESNMNDRFVRVLRSGYVSFTSIFPFSSSIPIFTIATLGFLIPTTCSM